MVSCVYNLVVLKVFPIAPHTEIDAVTIILEEAIQTCKPCPNNISVTYVTYNTVARTELELKFSISTHIHDR